MSSARVFVVVLADDSRAPCVRECQRSILVDLPPRVLCAPLLHARSGRENHTALVRDGTAQLVCSMGTVVAAFAVLVRKAWKLLPLILTPPWFGHTVQVMR